MDIAVLGTGGVGRTIGSGLVREGYRVRMGSRTADNPAAVDWVRTVGERASQGTFADAAAFGELVFNCTAGTGSLQALEQAGAENLAGKILVDVANPLDFSRGMPPSLTVCNTDSLGEQIQRAFPAAHVVKTLNTINCEVMVNPALVSGDHQIYLCGNDLEAKAFVRELLSRAFGWRKENVLDLGDITAARTTEMLVPLWVRLMGRLGTPYFSFRLAMPAERPPAVEAPVARVNG
jgi:8-hydroxy-5-deazaflavin:NADPH oxidoreductase